MNHRETRTALKPTRSGARKQRKKLQRDDRRLHIEPLESRLLLAFNNVSSQYVGPYLARTGYDLQPVVMQDSTAPAAQKFKTFWLGEYNPADMDIPRTDPLGQLIPLPGDRIYAATSPVAPNGAGSLLSAPKVVYKPQGGATGAFATDDHLVGAPSVVKVGGTYYMFIETYGNWLTRINRLFSFTRGDTWTTNGTADLAGNLADGDPSYAVEATIDLGFAPRYRRDGTHAVYSGQLVAPNGKINRFLSTTQIVPHTDASGTWSRLNSGEAIFWLFSNPGTGRKPLYSYFDGAHNNTYVTDSPTGGGVPGAVRDYNAGPDGVIGYTLTDLTVAPDSLGSLQNRIRMLTSTDGTNWTPVDGIQTNGALIAPQNERTTVYPHSCNNLAERYDPHRDYGSGYPIALERDGYLELYFSDDTESFAGKSACGMGPQMWRIRIPLSSVGDPTAYANATRQRTHIAEAGQGPGTGYYLSDIKWSPRLQRYFAFNIGEDGNPEIRYSEVRPDPTVPPEFPAANKIAVTIPANLWTGWGGILGDELGHTIEAADHTALSLIHEVLPRGSNDNHSRDFTHSLVLIYDDLPRAPVWSNFSGDRASELVTYRDSDGQWLERDMGTGTVFPDYWGGPGQSAIAGVDFDGDKVSDHTTYNSASGVWNVRQSTNGQNIVLTRGGSDQVAVGAIDIDGDGRTDLTSYRPSDGTWFIRTTLNGNLTIVPWGGANQIPVGGMDIDGDNRTDLVTYRITDGRWFIRITSTGQPIEINWGGADNVPVGGIDFDGDKKTDLAAYRVTDGVWSIRLTSSGQGIPIQWGGSDQIPVGGMDVDGDGRSDLVAFRPSDRIWSLRYSSGRPHAGITHGGVDEFPPVNATTLPIGPAAATDQLGVARLSANGAWYLDTDRDTTHEIDINFGSPDNQAVVGNWVGTGDFPGVVDAAMNWFLDTDGDNETEITPFQFGLPGDVAVAGDWNGDGIDDAGVFRNGTFYLDYFPRGYQAATDPAVQFGRAGDLPFTGDWNGDGWDELGVYRPSEGRVILDVGPSRGFDGEAGFLFGQVNDKPVAGDVNGDGRDDVLMGRAGGDGLMHWFALWTSNAPNSHGQGHEDEYIYGFPNDVPLVGKWKLPEITLDNGQFWSGWPTTIDVGTYDCGATATRTFTVSNQGTVPLQVQNVQVPAGFSVIDPVTSPLPAGGSDALTIRMSTAGQAVFAGPVTISNSDGNEKSFVFNIRGEVRAPDLDNKFAIVPLAVDCAVPAGGNYEFAMPLPGLEPTTAALRISNQTNAEIAIGAIEVTGDFQLVAPPAAVVPAKGWSGFKVLLTNTSIGAHQGHVRVHYGADLVYAFDVLATVASALPNIAVGTTTSPIVHNQIAPLSLGTTNAYDTAVRTFIVTNSGQGPLQLGTPTVNSPNFVLVNPSFPSSLAPGATFRFDAMLVATTDGTYDADVSIPSNDPDTPTFKFKIAGQVNRQVQLASSKFQGRAFLSFSAPVTLAGLAGSVGPNAIVLLDATQAGFQFTLPFQEATADLELPGENIDSLAQVSYQNSSDYSFVISISGVGNVPGVGAVYPADLIRYTRFGNSASWTRVFNAASFPELANANIDAHQNLFNGAELLSFDAPVTLPRVGTVGSEDIVEFKNNTWSLYLDGSSVGLEIPSEGISGIAAADELYITTAGNHQVQGFTGGPADVAKVDVITPDAAYWLGEPLRAADFGLGSYAIDALELIPTFGIDRDPSNPIVLASELPKLSYGATCTDGRLSVCDINSIIQSIRNGTTSPIHDSNSDFVVDSRDLELFLRQSFGTVFGDANLDQRVDRQDAAVIASLFGGLTGFGWSSGDMNGDGRIDMHDLARVTGSMGYGVENNSADALVARASPATSARVARSAAPRLVAVRRKPAIAANSRLAVVRATLNPLAADAALSQAGTSLKATALRKRVAVSNG